MKRLGMWLLTTLLGVEFCLTGLSKFRPSSAWPRMFSQWGFPPWFLLVVGVTEVLCGVALFAPRTRRPACVVLLGLMAGAIAAHLVHGEPRRLILPVVLSAMLGLLGWRSVRSG